jgi:hypothetical protein
MEVTIHLFLSILKTPPLKFILLISAKVVRTKIEFSTGKKKGIE